MSLSERYIKNLLATEMNERFAVMKLKQSPGVRRTLKEIR